MSNIVLPLSINPLVNIQKVAFYVRVVEMEELSMDLWLSSEDKRMDCGTIMICNFVSYSPAFGFSVMFEDIAIL